MSKLARAVLDTISAFPPNRDTLGATAYLIVENQTHILIDCPAWDQENQQFLQDRGGVSWLIITHRGGIGKVKEIQAAFGCQVLIQEQEAYLLPDLEVTTFEQEFNLTPQTQVIWTPGHSPGSSCVYSNTQGGVLFTGRHLLPNQQGLPVPLRTSKTFHWWRQLRSVAQLRDRFSPNTLNYLCPGANTGFLRGKRVIAQAYQHLAALDLQALRLAKAEF
ncbi:MAG: MBL fold metallo-hydrolase [Phormidium sp.]